MKRFGTIALVFLCLILVSSLFGCSSKETVELISTDEAALTPSPTAVASPTATPSPEPAEAPFFSEERKAELNLQIQDFLSKKGDFTPEKVSSMMLEPFISLPNNEVGLGVVDSVGPRLEGYFFDYIEKDGSLIMLMGFDGKDGNRFITPIEIALYFLKGEPKAYFYFKQWITFNDIAEITNGDVSGLFFQLDSSKEKFIIFEPGVTIFPESKPEDGYSEFDLTYYNKYDSKVILSKKLISLVNTNGISFGSDLSENELNEYRLPEIKNTDDLKNISLSEIPLTNSMILIE